jgi:hypothetical protein
MPLAEIRGQSGGSPELGNGRLGVAGHLQEVPTHGVKSVVVTELVAESLE